MTKTDLDKILEGWGRPRTSRTYNGWRFDLLAPQEDVVWKLQQEHKDDDDEQHALLQELTVATISKVTAEDGTELTQDGQIRALLRRMSGGQLAALSGIAINLGNGTYDAGFSEPQSPETSDSEAS